MVTKQALSEVDQHWAVSATGDDRETAFRLASDVHARRSLAGILDGRPPLSDADISLMQRVATAYELAAVEDSPVLLQPYVPEESREAAARARAGAHRAFELFRALPIDDDPRKRIFSVLHVLALAYAGDRWTDARRWLNELVPEPEDPDQESDWDQRILATLYGFWIALVRKDGWEQLTAIEDGVARLRAEQADYESRLLEANEGSGAKSKALILIALYHWARATELLGTFLAKGEPAPAAIASSLDQHFEPATAAAAHAGDPLFEVLLRWLHVAARQMSAGAVWGAADGDPRISEFIEHLTRSQCVFEFLPPQRAALQEQGLLDAAKRAVVVDLPTSGGKTALAEFRILQALNQFQARDGWVAYVAPTRALVSQIARRLRSDFVSLDIEVEALTSAVEIDSFEGRLLSAPAEESSFHVLVLTPEKLDMVIRNNQVERPLALVVIDEAQNLEDETRGLTIELLLATIKRDIPEAHFLLLMPFVPNASDLALWLSPETGASISLGAGAWQPNELLLGTYSAHEEAGKGDWSLAFDSLMTTARDSVQLEGTQKIGDVRPVGKSWSAARNSLTTLTAGMALSFSERGTAVGIARRIPDTWSMARLVAGSAETDEIPESVRLVQRFLATEISPEFELIGLLEKRVAVHHAGLSDDARALVEWLAESGDLRVLCATTTLAQGIDFPVSSLFLASRSVPSQPPRDMTAREFWNLAGRAGRIRHDSLGVVGLANSPESAASTAEDITRYVRDVATDLVSRLDQMLDELWRAGELNRLSAVIHREQWASFRSYVAHLWAEKKNLDAVLAETEGLLRNTLGYSSMRAADSEAKQQQAAALLEATKEYAHQLSKHPENALLADSTGFSPEGVRDALLGLREADGVPNSFEEWQPGQLLTGGAPDHLAGLVGVMLNVPELNGLDDLRSSGLGRTEIARIAQSWVSGATIEDIARQYFATGEDPDLTVALTSTCRALYRTLANFGSWGISALSKMPTSGIDHEQLTEEQLASLNSLPAMIYHGVSTEGGVLMRMNSAPRSVADNLGELFQQEAGQSVRGTTAREARQFLSDLKEGDWETAAPEGAALTGADYREVWQLLTGQA